MKNSRYFGAALAILLSATSMASAATPAPFEDWAFQTLATIQTHYALPDGLYRQQPDHGGPSDLWAAGIQLSALNAAAFLDPSRIPAAARYADALEAYRTEAHGIAGYAPVPHGGERYYDDNEWVILGLLETYELTHQHRFLKQAEMLMKFVQTGESPDLGGGIWWRENQRDSKNTCSNAPAICCALRLYSLNHDPKLLMFAHRIYIWTNAHFQDHDGLYFDGLKTDGSIQKTKWSYNTALMLRANCLFYKITKEPIYLSEAQRIAAAAEKHWFRRSDGALKDDSQFAHLLCEALLDLTAIDHNHERVEKVDRALQFLHNQIRLPDGLYPKRWEKAASPNDHDFNLMFQASAARGYGMAASYP